MQDQIFPLNVDPMSPLGNGPKKKNKLNFKQWFQARKRMLGLVFGVCLLTVGALVYPFLGINLQLGKGMIFDGTYNEYMAGSVQNVKLTIPSAVLGQPYGITFDLSTDLCEVADSIRVKIDNVEEYLEKTPTKLGGDACGTTGGWMQYQWSGALVLPGTNTVSITASDSAELWNSGEFEVSKETPQTPETPQDLGFVSATHEVKGSSIDVTWTVKGSACETLSVITTTLYNADTEAAIGDAPSIILADESECNPSSTSNFSKTVSFPIGSATSVYFSVDKPGFFGGGMNLFKSDPITITTTTVPDTSNALGIATPTLNSDGSLDLLWTWADNLVCDNNTTTSYVTITTYDKTTNTQLDSKEMLAKCTVQPALTLSTGQSTSVYFNIDLTSHDSTDGLPLYSNIDSPIAITRTQISPILTTTNSTLTPTNPTITFEYDTNGLAVGGFIYICPGNVTFEDGDGTPCVTTNFQSIVPPSMPSKGTWVWAGEAGTGTTGAIASPGPYTAAFLVKNIWSDPVSITVSDTFDPPTLTAAPSELSSANPEITFNYNMNGNGTSGSIYIYPGFISLQNGEAPVSPISTITLNTGSGTSEWAGIPSASYTEYTAYLAVNKTGGKVYSSPLSITVNSSFIGDTDPDPEIPDPTLPQLVLTTSTPNYSANQKVGTEIPFVLKVISVDGFSSGKCFIDYKDGTTDEKNCSTGDNVDFKYAYKTANTIEKPSYTPTASVKLIDGNIKATAISDLTYNITAEAKVADTPVISKLTLTASPESPQKVGTKITFTMTGIETNGVCTVDFGDGTSLPKQCFSTDTNKTFDHTYTTASDTGYTVTATTKLNADAIATATYNLPLKFIVTPADPAINSNSTSTPSLSLSPDDTSPEITDEDEGVEVEFTLTAANMTAPYTYEIDFGDDNDNTKETTSAAQKFTNTYDSEDDYDVVAKVTDSNNKTATATYTLEVTEDLKTTTKDKDTDTDTDTEEICTNGKDDDGDKLIDYQDTKDCPISTNQVIKISSVQITKSKFNPDINATRITYTLSKDSNVTVEILDSAKKKVVTLLDKQKQTAKNKVGEVINQSVWFEGTVDNKAGSQKLPDGTYTYKILAASLTNDTITDTKEGAVVIDSKDTVAGDWEQSGNAGTGTTTNIGTTGTAGGTLATGSNLTGNIASLTMQNTPPGTTSGTGPDMLIYLVFPAISAFALTRKK